MKVGFFSTMTGMPWGGSEQLWSRAARVLLDRGHEVTVNYKWWDQPPPSPLQAIDQQGGTVTYRERQPLLDRIKQLGRSAAQRLGVPLAPRHRAWLRREAPDIVLISSGWHTEDHSIARTCHAEGIPYAIILHCAGWSDWIPDTQIPDRRRVYTEAERCFFVSDENREIIETNLACTLDHATVVDNPINVDPEAAPTFPDASDGWQLACIGRLHCRSKGQDIILRVLRSERWRQRPLRVVFYGRNQDSEQRLRALVDQYDLHDQVEFAGFTPLEQIWSASHALLLPSRFEGMPMVTLEAMLWKRPAIVTDCGRNGVFVDDAETGFLVPAATASLLDDALNRAWNRRHDWEAMGAEAARRIPDRYGDRPVETFADHVESLLPGSVP